MKRSHIRIPLCFNRKWVIPLSLISTISLILLLTTNQGHHKSPPSFPKSEASASTASLLKPPELPRLAYLLSGTRGDGRRLKRLLQAAYHPRNYYLLHLDLGASAAERLELARDVKSEAVVGEFGNVMVVGKANLVTYKGPTMVALTLHAVAILLKKAKWDWFINLSSEDYPLMPQDG
ncbi:hypothetical protein CsSME_00038595 [Camellia sinensis var. sinensis]|uniref:Uncharacterized protein n=1 Tax=Camellia sinensis var. sinensis TaxID=542762 RepID=A0A4S4EQK0_CAMSN|nr:hypothetical protein TEA_023770 [Camellia sinensis var. sinensis]